MNILKINYNITLPNFITQLCTRNRVTTSPDFTVRIVTAKDYN